MIASGQNPYLLIGPHKLIDIPTPIVYPVPAFVALLPFTIFSYHLGGALFVAISSALLAWGATFDGWHRVPIFVSITFLTSARLGQWSILMTAAYYVPAMAFFAIVKPQASAPVVAAAKAVSSLGWALLGAACLIAISFVLFPGWPVEWWKVAGQSAYFVPPIARVGGPAIALVLLRWRRRETWLVFIAACLPQTWYPYNGLILLVVAETYREACFLSLTSSLAWIGILGFFDGPARSSGIQMLWGATLVATSYLPAVLLILRRPNEGGGPWWLRPSGSAHCAGKN
jgi:hypothetical protein